MRAVVQRVSRACVKVDGVAVGEIGKGLLVLLGVSQKDMESDADYMAEKIAGLRVFEDGDGKMNRSVTEGEAGRAILVVSQFTQPKESVLIFFARPEEANQGVL